MEVIEIILIAIGLGMDSFAVSICKGLSMNKMNWKKAVIIGIYFGAFQAGMPVIGYFLGKGFENVIQSFDHWIAFFLLSIIGVNMIMESIKNDSEKINDSIDFKTMLILSVATSIDALTVGITFAFLKVNILIAIIIIGIIALSLSIIGVKIGCVFGNKYEKKAQLLGGIILILMGTKILLEHLEIINF